MTHETIGTRGAPFGVRPEKLKSSTQSSCSPIPLNTIDNNSTFQVLTPSILKNLIAEWLRTHGIDPACRAETLGVEEYARLADAWVIFPRSAAHPWLHQRKESN